METLAAQFRRIVLIVAAVFVIGSGPSWAQDAASEADSAEVQRVIEDQLQAFGSGDHARAYSHASPAIRQLYPSVDSFVNMVQRGYDAIYSSQAHAFGRNLEVGGQVHQEVIVTDPAGKQWQAVYTLKRQEDGSWKITGVKLEPYRGASA